MLFSSECWFLFIKTKDLDPKFGKHVLRLQWTWRFIPWSGDRNNAHETTGNLGCTRWCPSYKLVINPLWHQLVRYITYKYITELVKWNLRVIYRWITIVYMILYGDKPYSEIGVINARTILAFFGGTTLHYLASTSIYDEPEFLRPRNTTFRRRGSTFGGFGKQYICW